MNLDEFLKKCARHSSNLRFDEWQDEGAAMEKLIALVRKLREQRDGRPVYDEFDSHSEKRWMKWRDEDNAALDEIVREG